MADVGRRRLLVLDTSYALEAIRDRRLEASVTCRDLDGYFDHVWSVHPFATLVTSDAWGERSGPPDTYAIAPRHTLIEGKVGRWRALEPASGLNFLASQADMLRSLIALVRRERISVVRAGDPLYLGLLGWAVARACGIPLVVRVGGNNDKVFATTGQPLMPRLFRTRKLEKVVERFVLRHADLVAGANQDNLDFALANGAARERSTLFRYGNLIHPRHFVDPAGRGDAAGALADIGVSSGAFLLYVGRLEPVKHPDDVVRVLAHVRALGHDVKAVLVGDGRMGDALRDLARTFGVEASLVLAGSRDQEWLARIIPHAAVVVSPHTGRALSETALGARPIVAYDIDWQGEVIESGVTGELVPHGDVHALAERTAALLMDRSRAARLGESVRRRMAAMMDPELLNGHERAWYDRLIDRTVGRVPPA